MDNAHFPFCILKINEIFWKWRKLLIQPYYPKNQTALSYIFSLNNVRSTYIHIINLGIYCFWIYCNHPIWKKMLCLWYKNKEQIWFIYWIFAIQHFELIFVVISWQSEVTKEAGIPKENHQVLANTRNSFLLYILYWL